MYSFIVSIYNVENYLAQCLDSIINQTYGDFEVILVDDGSTDNSGKICDQFQIKDNRIRVIHKQNEGLMSTRKIGVKEAKGKYICFIDGDDYISSDLLETYKRIHSKFDIDVICCGYTESYIDENKEIKLDLPTGLYNKNKLEKEIYPYMLSKRPFFNFFINPSVWSKCFKKELIQDLYEKIPLNISLGEDVALTYDALLKAENVYILGYTGYMYRQNPKSMTHTYDKKLFEKVTNLATFLEKNLSRSKFNLNKQTIDYIIYLLYLSIDNEFKYNDEKDLNNKIKNFSKYLNVSVFNNALREISPDNLKDKFIILCLKHRLLHTLYVFKK